ncbi:MAG: cupin domain-containing protein, partial [Solirubrobacteraceae bacterium]
MDAIAGLLDGPRARGAFLLRSVHDPPWCLRIQDEAPLTVMAVVRGGAWVAVPGRDPVRMGVGDVAIVSCREPYDVADAPGTAPRVLIHPGQRCQTLDGEDLAERFTLGVRTWGARADGETVLLTGTYEDAGAISQRILAALPDLILLPADGWSSPLVPLLADEIARDAPGQEAVLDRLLDLLLISGL